MCNILEQIDFEKTIKAISLLVAIIGLLKALYEYTKAQRWKKAEFLAKEVKEFYGKENVQRAILMLDWNIIDIPLFENEIENKKLIRFNDKMLIDALKHHDETYFTNEETIIRLIMDDFLFSLGMFQSYIDSKLITKDDIKPYLSYIINLIGDLNLKRKEPECIIQLWKYVNYYDYLPIIKLLKNFNYDIKTDNKPTIDENKKYNSAGG